MNSDGQFKPFVYLNGLAGSRMRQAVFQSQIIAAGRATANENQPQKKIPPFGGTFLLSLDPGSRANRHGLAISIGILTLAIRILLLLAGLLPAALLLTRFLAQVLVLLTRILVLVGHQRSPLLVVLGQRERRMDGFIKSEVPS